MALELGVYQYKPISAFATRVTRENIHEVTEWVNGIGWSGTGQKFYITRPSQNPPFVGNWGDWVYLSAGFGYRIVSPPLFRQMFEPVLEEEELEIDFNQTVGLGEPNIIAPSYGGRENTFDPDGHP